MTEGTIRVKYNDSDWKLINARPTSYRQAIGILYAVAPFEKAEVRFPIMGMYSMYIYEKGKVRKWL